MDLTGIRFGRLFVHHRDLSRKGATYYFCECACNPGVILRESILSYSLTRKHGVKSCGCIRDLTGQRFVRILVVRRGPNDKWGHAVYYCLCDCGNIKNIKGNALSSGNTTSCGCLQREIMKNKYEELRQQEIGQIYNGMKILNTWLPKNENEDENQTITIAQILCYCGNSFECELNNVKSGNTKSCGCIHKFEKGEASFNLYFGNNIRKAEERKCFFGLEKEDCREIVIQNCKYCDCEPREIYYNKNNNGPFFGNGLDQVIARGGYTKENCVSCCPTCNGLKLNLSLEAWLIKIKRICNKNYNNLFFNYDFIEVSEELLKKQKSNFQAKKSSSKTRQLENTLTEQQYYCLATSICFYCDANPENFGIRSKDFHQGIDRKDNDLGYIFLNCLPCCQSCNAAKLKMPYEDFINYLKKLQQYQISLKNEVISFL